MGDKLGTIFARAGHEVVFSYAGSQKNEVLEKELDCWACPTPSRNK